MKPRLEAQFAGLRYQSMDIDAFGEHDYTSLEGIEQRFDLVYAFEVAEHIDRGAIAPWIDSMARLLKPGGRLVLSTPNTFYPPAYLRDITHLTPLCYDEFGAVIESTGLRVERIVRQVLRTTWRGDRLADLLTAAPGLWEERKRIREAGWFN